MAPDKEARPWRPDSFNSWSRGCAAIMGGYVLSSAAAVALADIVPLGAAEATVSGSLLSIVVFTCAVLWSFVARTNLRAWLGIFLPAAFLILAASLGR